MTDKWFDEYNYEIVVHKKAYISKAFGPYKSRSSNSSRSLGSDGSFSFLIIILKPVLVVFNLKESTQC